MNEKTGLVEQVKQYGLVFDKRVVDPQAKISVPKCNANEWTISPTYKRIVIQCNASKGGQLTPPPKECTRMTEPTNNAHMVTEYEL